MRYIYFLSLSVLFVLSGCYKGKCYQCRKFAPASNGQEPLYIGTEKVCPDKDNINLVDPVIGDSTDLWECERF